MGADTDHGHPKIVFFQISQIFWPIGQISQIGFEVFKGILGHDICPNFVTVFLDKKLGFRTFYRIFYLGLEYGFEL